MKEILIPAEKLPVIEEADICVIGGSCTGVFAAIRAARLGAKVVLIEKQNRFGGVATTGLVCMWHSLFDITGDKQIIGGLTFETMERLEKRKSISPFRDGHGYRHIAFNSEELTLELDAMVSEEKNIRNEGVLQIIPSSDGTEGIVGCEYTLPSVQKEDILFGTVECSREILLWENGRFVSQNIYGDSFIPEKIAFYAGAPTAQQEDFAVKLVKFMDNMDEIMSAEHRFLNISEE